MFTVVYTQNGDTITATNVRSIDIAPQNDRSEPQFIRLNAGVGGGGQLGFGTIVPIANVTSITVTEV